MPKIRKVILLITPSRKFTRGLLRGIAKYSRIQSRKRGESFGKTVTEAGYSTYFYKQPRAKTKRTWDKELPIPP